MQVNNPANGETIIEMSSCGEKETNEAIARAEAALPPWRAAPASQREQFLLDWKAAILKNKDDIARIMTIECGKARSLSFKCIVTLLHAWQTQDLAASACAGCIATSTCPKFFPDGIIMVAMRNQRLRQTTLNLV